MERYSPLFYVIGVFVLAIVPAIGHASLSSEAYWQTVLPNTPMPNFFRDSLHPATSSDVGKDGNNLDIGKVVLAYAGYKKYRQEDFDKAPFFLGNDLHPGTKLNMIFPKAIKSKKFLPRSVADATPFSSSKISEIIHRFSIKPDSRDAQSIKETIRICEEPAMEGETKICTTSLESMIDFTTSKLGTHVQVLATKVEKETPKQQYIITTGMHKMSDQLVVCHAEPYVYQVYYCHKMPSTSAYIVPLVGEDGTRVDAVAVCHQDTSHWNSNHLAFRMLKVKPGPIPMCHFIPEGSIVWVQN